MTAIADCCNAAAFSIIIRWYSAGVQTPRAIRAVRRAIVSHEAIASSAIISGSDRARRRLFII
jgi:hypothetical protein